MSHTVLTPAGPLVAVRAVIPTCGCGQALEACRYDHCPRCGITLRSPRVG